MSYKTKKKSKIGIVLLIIILILLGIAAGTGYSLIQDKLSKINFISINKENLNIHNDVANNLKDYRNILLLATDTRDIQNDDGSRSDGIIIASIDKKAKEVRLISVYRDSYLEINGYGLDKVTHAYAYGGAELSIATINKNLDLNITEFATVNFEAVAKIVDLVGGINIDITSEELKYINGYIDETSKVIGTASKHLTKAGTQKLDGVQAVAYARIRYTAGGDYKRTERMRTVIMKAFDKCKDMSISKLNSILDEMLPYVQTNINANELIMLLPQLSTYKITDNTGWPYEVKGITLDRWYGVPVTLEENVKKLHNELFGQSDYEPTDVVKEISNKIIKKTGYK